MIVRLRISGRVQGVGYRAWTARQATLRGLSGWVRNLDDGSVETVLSGVDDAVLEMIDRCWRGPTLARVDAITQEVEDAAPDTGFRQLPSARAL
jgi:acylphosphatase